MSDSLAAALEKVAELYEQKDEADKALKEIKRQIDSAEKVAVEQLAASGLDGVRAAGKSWYLRDFWSVSIPADRKQEAVAIAENAGLGDFVAVNTASLKSWLVEQHKERGGDSLTAGTPFEGLVSEYHESRLSRVTLPKE